MQIHTVEGLCSNWWLISDTNNKSSVVVHLLFPRFSFHFRRRLVFIYFLVLLSYITLYDVELEGLVCSTICLLCIFSSLSRSISLLAAAGFLINKTSPRRPYNFTKHRTWHNNKGGPDSIILPCLYYFAKGASWRLLVRQGTRTKRSLYVPWTVHDWVCREVRIKRNDAIGI